MCIIRQTKTMVYDAVYVFLNYFVAYIPCWRIRKIIYLSCGLKIGRGSRICMRSRLMEPWNIELGENTIVNEACILDGRGMLKIGNNCSISTETIIYTATHSTGSKDFAYYEKSTIIGDGVWVGARAMILPGVEISENSVIGACSVVTTGIYESKGIYVGIPAKRIKERDIDAVDNLKHFLFFR